MTFRGTVGMNSSEATRGFSVSAELVFFQFSRFSVLSMRSGGLISQRAVPTIHSFHEPDGPFP